MKKIYSGYLKDDYEVGSYDNLILADDFGDGLINDILDDCGNHGNFVKFRYYVSDKEFDLKDIDKYLIESYFGLSDIVIKQCGCPTCGYMCVDKATIGGHNICEELLNYMNKYIIIEIDYYKDEEDFYNRKSSDYYNK